MKDLEYQSRFVNCFMNHYKHLYELHVFTQLEQLKESKSLEYAVIITGEYSIDEMTNFVERGEVVLDLLEFPEAKLYGDEANYICMEKYQEVYKIAEKIERLSAEWMQQADVNPEKGYEIIGIYSLSQEAMQIPFAALLGNIIGEQEKVLLLDLQHYSGLGEYEEGAMGLEDLLSVALSGNYSKGRLLECIRHEGNWDYAYPVQNNVCLTEGNQSLYENLIQILTNELGYKKIILNLGAIFEGVYNLMDACTAIYLLSAKTDEQKWREQVFTREVSRLGKETLLKKIKSVVLPDIPREVRNWKHIVEKWSCMAFAETLRCLVKKEGSHGAIV